MKDGSNHMNLKDKISMVQGIKSRDSDKVFGMTPADYRIFMALGKIDIYGGE